MAVIPIDMVVAVDLDYGIGRDGKIPWRLKGDLQRFREITCQTRSASKRNVVLMGRKTWESLPQKFRPLPERINLVLSRNKSLSLPDGVLKAEDLLEAVTLLNEQRWQDRVETIFIIGGGEVFRDALTRLSCRYIYLTQILKRFDCDTVFPEFKNRFREIFVSGRFTENFIEYYFTKYECLS